MLNTCIGIEINILKEVICLNVYLKTTFLYPKNGQNTVIAVREKKKVYLYSLCRARDKNHHITFKVKEKLLSCTTRKYH